MEVRGTSTFACLVGLPAKPEGLGNALLVNVCERQKLDAQAALNRGHHFAVYFATAEQISTRNPLRSRT